MTCGQVRTFGAYTFPISKLHDTGGPILHVFSKYLFLLLNEYEHEPSCLSFPSFHLKARIPESVSELRGQPSLRRRPVTKRVPSTPRVSSEKLLPGPLASPLKAGVRLSLTLASIHRDWMNLPDTLSNMLLSPEQ
jgi:hypothetical protein